MQIKVVESVLPFAECRQEYTNTKIQLQIKVVELILPFAKCHQEYTTTKIQIHMKVVESILPFAECQRENTNTKIQIRKYKYKKIQIMVVESISPFSECHRGSRDTMGHIYWLGECHVRIDYTFTLTIKFIQQQIIKQSLVQKLSMVKDLETSVFFQVPR